MQKNFNLNEGDNFICLFLGSLTVKFKPEVIDEQKELGVRIVGVEEGFEPFFDKVFTSGTEERMNSGNPGSHSIDIDALVSIDASKKVVFDGKFFEDADLGTEFLMKLGIPKDAQSLPVVERFPLSVNCKYPTSIGTLTLNVEPTAADASNTEKSTKVKFDVFEYEHGSEKQYGPDQLIDEDQEAEVDTKSAGASHFPDYIGKVKVNKDKACFDGRFVYGEFAEIEFYFEMKV